MEQLVNFIIRPPRAEYSPDHDLLDEEFMLKGKWYNRKDIAIKNKREDTLQCSRYLPVENPEGKALPCVIYCHGNSGCRADASEAAVLLLPLNITVFTLDFSGSELSGGEHVTLGWNEKDDLKAVVDYLRTDGNVSMIGLWGRSMGAVTSLMYGAEDLSIAGMVLDSPFSDLVDLMMELVDTYKVRLPKFTVKFAIQYMRKAIQKKAKFDIMDLNTIKGDKNIIQFEGDHNSIRPTFYFDSISIFFNNVLQPPEDGFDGTLDFDPMHDYIDRSTWNALHRLGYVDGNPIAFKGPATTGGDAIQQLRARRPMSRMEVPPDITTGDAQQVPQEDGSGANSSSSSSRMINFELANGQPYGPHVPSSLEDDHFVEYPLDYSADFPCDLEEEERMLMEAVMESLKDLQTNSTGTEEPAPSQSEPSASSTDYPQPPSTDSTSLSTTDTEVDLSQKKPDIPDVATTDTEVVSEQPPLELSTCEPHDVKDVVASASSSDSGFIPDSGKSDTSPADVVKSSVDNSSEGMKAAVTLAAERPPGNIIDEDRNLFRK
ncbi:hypothetical protein AKJ16_DCAP02553 [Drosera capensis]